MKQADSLLLNALKAAVHNEKAALGVLPQETQTELLRQAVRHGVLPLVLDACGNALKAARRMAFCQTAEQILKTQVFLQLYSKLREMKLHPLVLKGPVCAVLYPKPELRLFSDVDLLAVSGEFDRTRNALLQLGCRTAGESVDPLEQTFYLPGSPLVLELHGAAFPENDAYGHMKAFFAHEKLRTETVFVQGEEIYTLGANETFLYLLCHSLKHFLHGGCGIRAVCDLLLFAEKHEKELDKLYLRRCCEKLSALEFLTALFEIGEKYLGFEKTESLALLRVHPAPDETALLEDILAGGVHGAAEKSRLHSANMTLHAAAVQNAEKCERFSVLRAAFPSAKALHCAPHSLPAAWGRRLIRYGKENIQNRTSLRKSVEIGKRRVALLKTYHLIK